MTISSPTPEGERNELLVWFKRLRFINERVAPVRSLAHRDAAPDDAPLRKSLNRDNVQRAVEEVLGP